MSEENNEIFDPQPVTVTTKKQRNSQQPPPSETPPLTSKEAFIYLGPNMPGGLLYNGSVFRDIPEHIAGLIETTPEIQDLFVEVKQAAKFKSELLQKGSEAARLYQAVQAAAKGGAVT